MKKSKTLCQVCAEREGIAWINSQFVCSWCWNKLKPKRKGIGSGYHTRKKENENGN